MTKNTQLAEIILCLRNPHPSQGIHCYFLPPAVSSMKTATILHPSRPQMLLRTVQSAQRCSGLLHVKADFEMDGFGRNPMIHVAGNCSHFPLQIRFTLVRITCQNTHTPKLPMLGPAPCRGKWDSCITNAGCVAKPEKILGNLRGPCFHDNRDLHKRQP